MKNQLSLTNAAVIAALIIGGGTHPVAAQQTPPPTASRSLIVYNSDSMRATVSGTEAIMTMQGHVKLGWSDGSPVALTTAPDYFAVAIPTNQRIDVTYQSANYAPTDHHTNTTATQRVFHVPMNMATLRVSVTPAGTIFSDQQGNTLTVMTQASLSASPVVSH